MNILETIRKDVEQMNDSAVRKWLERYQMAMFLIKGKLHNKGFDPKSISGEPPEMIDRLKIKLETLSRFSTEIAEIMKEYKVAYTNNVLNEVNSKEENLEQWKEYFADKSDGEEKEEVKL